MQPFAVPLETAAGLHARVPVPGGAGPASLSSSDNTTPRSLQARGVCFSPARQAGLRGTDAQPPGGADMFEGQPQAEIDALMKRDPEFKQLYQRHRTLDKKVMDADLGVLPIDDATLGQMKREKLAAKEKLLRIYDRAH
jgi:uncharacterized protein YdcH (DUF465 family)